MTGKKPRISPNSIKLIISRMGNNKSSLKFILMLIYHLQVYFKFIMEQIIKFSILIKDFLIPILIGSKIFFSLIVAPNTFKNLNEQNARKFIRSIFPKLYIWCLAISLIITISLLSIDIFHSFIFFLITIGYFYSREYLMIKINKINDIVKKKDIHKKQFSSLHNLSVLIFMTQLIAMIIIFFLSKS